MLDAKLKNTNYLFSLFLIAFGLNLLYSQQESPFSKTTIAEKIYLQLDSDIYSVNETIWFKAVVSTAVQNEPSHISGVLYVELINQEEEVLERKLIRLDKGIGDGFFDLGTTFTEGTYLVRAYTEWNKNFDSDFIFERYIRIFNSSNKKALDPFTHVNLEIKNDQSRWLKAEVDPSIIDSLHKNKTTLFVTIGEKKDSLILRKNQLKEYIVQYPLNEESNFVTLQLKTKNELSLSKTIVVNQDYLDFQFFPESGDLVHGLSSTVGFKVLDAHGKGKQVNGSIIGLNGKILTGFKSNELGMGKFTLNNVDSLQNYFAQIPSSSARDLLLNYPLPRIKKQGSVLSLTRMENNIKVQVTTTNRNLDSTFLKISSRGQHFYQVSGRFVRGMLRFEIPQSELPEGVLDIVLFDKFKTPILNRTFYNHNTQSGIQISIDTDKKLFEQRELTELSVRLKDAENNPIEGSISLLVINKNQKGDLQRMRENIVSYFLLSSDLKGKIENPGFYFNDGEIRLDDLDVLLLTQGWSRYTYKKPLDDVFVYSPEYSLQVSGKVTAAFSKKEKKKVKLTLMTFGEERSFQKQSVDSLGRFDFYLEPSYGDPLRVLIQSANKTGKNKNYTLTLDQKIPPLVSFNHVKTVAEVDKVVHKLVENNLEREQMDEMFQLSKGVNRLDEAVVTAYKITPQRTKVMERFGEPDVVIAGEDILEKNEKWSFGLYSVLQFNFPDQVRINRVKGELRAELFNTFPTLVVIDGIPVLHYNYSFIPSIPPSEVKSFEIIEYAKNFSSLYKEVYPRAFWNIPNIGNVIAIYTHAGNGLYSIIKPVGLLRTTVPVFSPIREFYKPKYDNLDVSDWLKPDLRALVHWEPTVSIDSLGIASTSYYNSDNLGETMIVVEVMAENGEVGYKELVYNIEQKEDKE